MAEQFETSPAGRQLRVDRSMQARREPDEIDAVVRLHIAASSSGTFTHEEIAVASGLSTMAAAFSLQRLHRLGVIAEVQRVRVRSQRFRSVWRATGTAAIPPDVPVAEPRKAAPGHSPRQPTHGRQVTIEARRRAGLSEAAARQRATEDGHDGRALVQGLTLCSSAGHGRR